MPFLLLALEKREYLGSDPKLDPYNFLLVKEDPDPNLGKKLGSESKKTIVSDHTINCSYPLNTGT
jgi:hypothetical protein